VDNYSLLLDLKIILSTFRTILGGEGVYTDDLAKFKLKSSGKEQEEKKENKDDN
jgi:hypothetical protein